MNLVFLGPPGSGKGTQSLRIKEKHNFEIISTGDILRNQIASKTELGLKADMIMKKGDLVPDELVIDLISNFIKSDGNYLFDGFPRNIAQAQKLDQMLSSINRSIDLVIEFRIDNSILEKRITGRYVCNGCKATYNKYFNNTKISGICDFCGSKSFIERDDDNVNSLLNRLKVYQEQSYPLVEYYEQRDILKVVDASEDIDIVSDKIDICLSKYLDMQ